jgi:hypothetical protein
MATRRRPNGERGQTTPFFLCFLVVMTMFVGLIVNVGQAVNRRMALQIAADAGAWTGATNMAIGMNALAEVNDWRRDVEPLISVGLPAVGWLGLSDVVITIWEVATTIINFVDLGVQVGYAKIPYDHASLVTWYNNQDLFPGEQLRWYEGFRPGFLSSGGDLVSAEMPFAKSRETICQEQPFLTDSFIFLPCVVDEEPIYRTQFYTVPCFPFGQCPRTYRYVKWWKKSSFEAAFIWVVQAPATRPHYNPFGLFGDDAIPEMTAVALAKPVGGTIESGSDDYRVKFAPLSKASVWPMQLENVLQGGVYDATVKRWRPVAY